MTNKVAFHAIQRQEEIIIELSQVVSPRYDEWSEREAVDRLMALLMRTGY